MATLSSAKFGAVQAMARNAVLAEVAGALTGAGVRPLLIKGPAVASWLYDDPGERTYGDIDLLVDPARFDAAEAVLERLGFRGLHVGLATAELPENAEHAHTWRRDRAGEEFVDLHRMIMLIPASPARAWAALSHDARPLGVGGAVVDTPAPPAHLLILVLHAAQHGAAQPRPIEDLRRAIARVDLRTWGEAAALAAELGAGSTMREGLRLADGGGQLADELALADDATTVVRLLAGNAPATALGVHHLLHTRGLRSRLRLIARKLVPTPAFMRLWHPLASRGPLGLALAYAWRPWWLAVKVPRGTLAFAAVALRDERKERLPGLVSGGWWALRAWSCSRVQLRRGGLAAVRLPSPPADRPGAQGSVHRVLTGVRASCLERSLVRQRWHAAHGRPRDVVIGVRGPASGFGAHAWLDGDRADPRGFEELTRWPPPSAR